MNKRSGVFTALFALLLAVTACSNTRFSGGNDNAEKTIGLSISTLNNPFFVDLRDGAQATAAKQGAKLIVTDAQMATLCLECHRFHGDWNYTIHPAATRRHRVLVS